MRPTRLKVSTGSLPASAWEIIRAGARWRLVYNECLVSACNTGNGLFYRDSSSGAAWSTASRFSNHLARPIQDGISIGYTSSGRTWIGWAGFTSATADDADIYVRSGQ